MIISNYTMKLYFVGVIIIYIIPEPVAGFRELILWLWKIRNIFGILNKKCRFVIYTDIRWTTLQYKHYIWNRYIIFVYYELFWILNRISWFIGSHHMKFRYVVRFYYPLSYMIYFSAYAKCTRIRWQRYP